MDQVYEKMYVCIQDKKKPPVGCGYYYTISAMLGAHTAFATKEGFKLWLNITGLKLGKRGWGNTVQLIGTYERRTLMLNNNEYYAQYGHLEPIRVMDNGDYCIGYVDRAGLHNIIYVQNPNTNRKELNYQESKKAIDEGRTSLQDVHYRHYVNAEKELAATENKRFH